MHKHTGIATNTLELPRISILTCLVTSHLFCSSYVLSVRHRFNCFTSFLSNRVMSHTKSVEPGSGHWFFFKFSQVQLLFLRAFLQAGRAAYKSGMQGKAMKMAQIHGFQSHSCLPFFGSCSQSCRQMLCWFIIAIGQASAPQITTCRQHSLRGCTHPRLSASCPALHFHTAAGTPLLLQRWA